MAALHRHRTQFGCLDLQTGAAVHGQDLARAGLAAALARGAPDAVYRWSERARAQALLLPTPRPPGHPAAAAALEELRQARHTLRAQELAGRPVSGLRARVEALQRSIREQSWAAPGRRDVPAPAPAPLRAIRDSLAGAALVTYLRDGPVLRALVVAGDSVRLRTVGGYAAAQEAVLRLRADLDSQAGRALPDRLAAAVRSATSHDAATAGSAVLSPLLADIGDRDLIVVPTGILMTVPWAALPGCAGRPVTVAPSATVWRDAMGRRGDRRPGPGSPGPDAATVLVAGPGNARGDAEIQAIAALRPGTSVLAGAAATPAATLAALDRAAVAHLAAHGQHQAENALFSTLELAGGPLLGYDLQRAGRAPLMVVLSSCDVGLTDVRPGDETFGMVTALLNAGSATVVASVARVADDAAMAAMVGFHRAVTAGRPPATALAAALTGEESAASCASAPADRAPGAAEVVRAWQAMAAAATTLRESTPAARACGAIGMHTPRSASCIQREDRPSPSVPSSSATRSSGRLPGPRAVPIGAADWSGVSASSRNPASRSCARPPYQSVIRAYGMAKTAPMDTFTARR